MIMSAVISMFRNITIPAAGIVFTLQGQGISYWKLADGCDNDGTGIMYDSATTSWIDKGAIVVNIHDRSKRRSRKIL